MSSSGTCYAISLPLLRLIIALDDVHLWKLNDHFPITEIINLYAFDFHMRMSFTLAFLLSTHGVIYTFYHGHGCFIDIVISCVYIYRFLTTGIRRTKFFQKLYFFRTYSPDLRVPITFNVFDGAKFNAVFPLSCVNHRLGRLYDVFIR